MVPTELGALRTGGREELSGWVLVTCTGTPTQKQFLRIHPKRSGDLTPPIQEETDPPFTRTCISMSSTMTATWVSGLTETIGCTPRVERMAWASLITSRPIRD